MEQSNKTSNVLPLKSADICSCNVVESVITTKFALNWSFLCLLNERKLSNFKSGHRENGVAEANNSY